jgi:voltage-gated potassium channel
MKTLKERLHRIIFGVDTSAGRAFDIVLLVLILASICFLMLETVEEFRSKWSATFKALDWIITSLFTIEYSLRVWTSENRKRYVFSFYGIVDLLSILPTYVSLFFVGTHALATIRVLRLLRIFRVLKLVQFMGEAHKLRQAMRTSAKKIVVFVFFVVIVSVIIGTLMFLIEGKEHGFTSIPRSIYWAIVTLTTVGYGDIAPQTPVGQILATVLMVTGYGVIAVPTGLVTAELVRRDMSDANMVKKCPSCGHETNRNDAKYCSNCGTSL